MRSNPAAQGRERDPGGVPGSGGLRDAHSGGLYTLAQAARTPASRSGGLYNHAEGQL